MTAPRLDLGELRRLHEAATPGPWDFGDRFAPGAGDDNHLHGVVYCRAYEDETPEVCGPNSDDWPVVIDDAAIIAAMRNALPALLSIWEAAEAWQKDEAVGAPRLRAALAAVRKEEKHGTE